MATLTIRNLDEKLKHKLRVRAAQHGRSMEEEVRHILRTSVARETPVSANLFDAVRARISPFGGAEMKLPPREKLREPPAFE